MSEVTQAWEERCPEIVAEVLTALQAIRDKHDVTTRTLFCSTMVTLGGVAAVLDIKPNDRRVFEMFRAGYASVMEELREERGETSKHDDA